MHGEARIHFTGSCVPGGRKKRFGERVRLSGKLEKGQSVALRMVSGVKELEIIGNILSFDDDKGLIALEVDGKQTEKTPVHRGKEATIVGRASDSDLDIPCVIAETDRFPILICREVDRRNHLRVNAFLRVGYRRVERESFESDPEAALLRFREEMWGGDHSFEDLKEGLEGGDLDPQLLSLFESLSHKLDRVLSLLEGRGNVQSLGVVPVNLSGSGVRFPARERMRSRELLALQIILPLSPPATVVLIGEVRRVREKGSREFETAVKFVTVDELDQEKIVHYTFKRMRESIRNRRNKEDEM
jgi:c-di-GMP-binding flagellar brake protein YcgR